MLAGAGGGSGAALVGTGVGGALVCSDVAAPRVATSATMPAVRTRVPTAATAKPTRDRLAVVPERTPAAEASESPDGVFRLVMLQPGGGVVFTGPRARAVSSKGSACI